MGYLPCLKLILLPRYLIAISVEYPFPNQGVIFISKRVLIKIETNRNVSKETYSRNKHIGGNEKSHKIKKTMKEDNKYDVLMKV